MLRRKRYNHQRHFQNAYLLGRSVEIIIIIIITTTIIIIY